MTALAILLALTSPDGACSGAQIGGVVYLDRPALACECVLIERVWGESEECEAIEPLTGRTAALKGT